MISAEAWKGYREDPAAETVDGEVAELYAATRSRLAAFVASRTHDDEVAGDIVQEAFLRLTVEAQVGRMPRQPEAWLFRVASNLVYSDARRAATARRARPHLARGDIDDPVDECLLRAELARDVRTALDRLPEPMRRALVLAAAGFGGPEIAVSIGRTELATRALLCRARKTIRRDLAEIDAGSGRPAVALVTL